MTSHTSSDWSSTEAELDSNASWKTSWSSCTSAGPSTCEVSSLVMCLPVRMQEMLTRALARSSSPFCLHSWKLEMSSRSTTTKQASSPAAMDDCEVTSATHSNARPCWSGWRFAWSKSDWIVPASTWSRTAFSSEIFTHSDMASMTALDAARDSLGSACAEASPNRLSEAVATPKRNGTISLRPAWSFSRLLIDTDPNFRKDRPVPRPTAISAALFKTTTASWMTTAESCENP
mmetsp:Transcript_1139/g.3999  ORF Transcript_1139/g.3999 Transcript_1139/m.3999 type:complete len:233 (-) Transcript_1139:472-1170(-)